VESKLHFAPNVEKRMTEFEARALKKPSNPLSSIVKFLVLPIQSRLTYYKCSRELAHLFKQHAEQKGWDREKLMRRLNAARSVVFAYLKGAQDVAQFTAYERLFSLWHVLHVPLVYMLVLSAIAHVIAVHIY
jgi:phosphate/sulfate permease